MPWLYSGLSAAVVAAYAYIPQWPVGAVVALAVVAVIIVLRVAEVRRSYANPIGGLLWRDDGWEVLGRAVQECRREERKLAVCRIPAGSASGRGALTAAAQFAGATKPYLRAGTSVCMDGDDVVLILPRTDRDETAVILARLERSLDVTGLDEAAMVSVFPDDAMTAGALIESVSGAVRTNAYAPSPATVRPAPVGVLRAAKASTSDAALPVS